MIGLLFDIDGCLTLPNQIKSVLDTDLIDHLLQLDNPIALVTGRSDGWLRKQYDEENRNSYLEIPTYIEFGLAMINGPDVKLQQQGSDFLPQRLQLIQLLAETCEKEDIYFEQEKWYNDYPDHGSLWVEQKHIQLSIAENVNLSAKRLHELCDKAWVDQNQVRILHHHLGIDVIPYGWSKARATSHFTQDLDESAYSWYVFGDNESDREMIEGLTNASFISTTETASHQVRKTLEKLNLLAPPSI